LRTAPAAAPDLVGGEREHEAPGRGVPRERGDREPVGGGQDRLYQVVDRVDVSPGLRRGIAGRLDHVQMDAVAEDVSRPAEHDHPDGRRWAYR
jgi:hypothetical protein